MKRPSMLVPWQLVLSALLVFVGQGCSGKTPRLPKNQVSAIWISADSAELTASTMARLKEAGIEEAFIPVARLNVRSGDPLERLEAPELGDGLPVTLSIEGIFNLSDEEEAQTAADLVADAARQLRFDLESQGRLVIGLHFDLRKVDDLGAYGVFLERLHSSMDDGIFLSASLERGWLDHEAIQSVTDSVDFVVAFLYGQRINEPESGEAWDFIALEKHLQRLEELGAPYQVGAVTLGTASHLSGNRLRARTTHRSLLDITGNRSLKLRPGFTLEGANRRVYSLIAERATQVGDWQIAAGDGIRIVRAATADIEELLRLVDLWDLPGHLGQAYYRLPAETELLSVHSDSLLNALDPASASPDLKFDVTVQRRTGRGWLLRFGLTNGNREFTELATLDNNYLQATSPSGRFTSSKIGTGDFQRYDLLKRTAKGLEPAFRQPNVVRFFVPILEGQQKVKTGDVELVGPGEPELVLEARFLLPDGRTLELGPSTWRGGRFIDE